jgi:RimJ/RimL family protein N-acetyltransferase
MTHLIPATAADYAWMLGAAPSRPDLHLPIGGVDAPETLAVIAGVHPRLQEAGQQGAWMMVADGEVVGLCGLVRPCANGEAEIGYGVAASRRNRGHATAAVAAMIADLRTVAGFEALTAFTDVSNLASQGALRRNGFQELGRRAHPDDGEQIEWRLALSA